VPDEKDLRLQLAEERIQTNEVNAKRDERMSVLEARFESLQGSYRLVVGSFFTLAVTVVGAAAIIILTAGGGGH
jgi:hypothetical protein